MGARYRLSGEIDMANVAELRADLSGLIATTNEPLEIDCTDLLFIDSQGVHALVDAATALNAKGLRLSLINVGDDRRWVFQTLGLDDLLG